MIRRPTFGLLVAIWGMVVLPVLCMGGMIHHACECEAATECQDEGEIPADPCRPPAVVRVDRSVDSVMTLPVAMDCPSIFVDTSAVLSPCFTESHYEGKAGENIPYAPSDVPLLI